MAVLIEDPLGYISAIQESIINRNDQEFRNLVITQCVLQQGIFWDCATEVCHSLSSALYKEAPLFFEACEEGLQFLINNGNPKEMLLIILEQIDDESDDLKFRTLMDATQTVLLKMPKKRVKSLDIAIETLMGHVIGLDLPEETNLEGPEKKLLEGDPHVARIGEVVRLFLQFLEPFIWEVSVKNPENVRERNHHQVRELTLTVLKLLGRPLLYVDLSNPDDTGQVAKTFCRQNAETVIQCLAELNTNFHKLTLSTLEHNAQIERANWIKDNKDQGHYEDDLENQNGLVEDAQSLEFEEPVSENCLACFTYLIHGEQLGQQNWPSVYTHTYVLCHCLPFIKKLIRNQNSLVAYKGLFLADSVLVRIPGKSLASDLLEIDDMTDLVLVLMDNMMFCAVTELRQLAVKLLQNFINKFVLEGRYKLMDFVLHKTSHSGIASLIIKLIKDQVAVVLHSSGTGKPFIGASLEKLVTLALKLPEGATSDLLDQSDRIMAGLNLVRFLILSDAPNVNKTGVWDRLEIIENEFLNPLKTGINMSRAHYQLEAKNVEEGKKLSDMEVNVTIAGLNTPAMSTEQKLSVLQNAVVTFDLMESVHGRVTELISSQKQSQKADAVTEKLTI